MTDVLIYGAPRRRRTCSTRSRWGSATRSCTPRPAAAGSRRRASSTPTRSRALGIEILDPSTLGADALFGQGLGRHEVALEIALRACREIGLDAGGRPAGVPARGRRPPARRRHRPRRRPRGVHHPPPAQDRRAARRHPARAEGRRRGDGRRREPDPRAAARAHLRGGPRRDDRGLRRARLRPPRRRDRRPRRAVGRRPRVRLRRAGGGRAGRRRHLAARPRVALLGGHDAHVRGRRRRARTRSWPSTGG